MKTRLRKTVIMLMALAVTFTCLPIMTGSFSHAATAKKPAQVTGVKKQTAGTNYITIKWKKIKNNENTKGYAICRNGKVIKKVGKGTLQYKDMGLAAGTAYKYQVRAYNSYKQYYNTATKKWQNKKPAKKSWKTKISKTKYVFGKYSAVLTVKTVSGVIVQSPEGVTPGSTPSTGTRTNPGSGSTGSTGSKPTGGSGSTGSGSGTGSSGQMPVTYKTFALEGEAPATIDKGGSEELNVTLPAKGFGVNWTCSDPEIVRVMGATGSMARIHAGDTYGTATITATLTEPSGSTYSGVKEISFTVKNTLYPVDSENAYVLTRTEDGHYNIGGYDLPGCFSVAADAIPSNSLIKVEAENMYKEYDEAEGLYIGKDPCSSNRSVVYVSHDYGRTKESPLEGSSSELFFAGEGLATVTRSDGKNLIFMVSGISSEIKKYVDLVTGWKNMVSGLSNTEKVKYTVQFIQSSYDYPKPCYTHTAMQMVIRGNGDCWAGNSLLYILCKEELGFDVQYRDASGDSGAGSGHRNCIITIDGTDYVCDATPVYGGTFMTYEAYSKWYMKHS